MLIELVVPDPRLVPIDLEGANHERQAAEEVTDHQDPEHVRNDALYGSRAEGVYGILDLTPCIPQLSEPKLPQEPVDA